VSTVQKGVSMYCGLLIVPLRPIKTEGRSCSG